MYVDARNSFVYGILRWLYAVGIVNTKCLRQPSLRSAAWLTACVFRPYWSLSLTSNRLLRGKNPTVNSAQAALRRCCNAKQYSRNRHDLALALNTRQDGPANVREQPSALGLTTPGFLFAINKAFVSMTKHNHFRLRILIAQSLMVIFRIPNPMAMLDDKIASR